MSPVQPCCRLWCQRQLSQRWMSRTNHGQSQAVERSILSFPGERCSVLREVLIVLWFAPLSRVCRSDPASDGNEDLGRRGRDRYASRLRWAQRTSADGSSAGRRGDIVKCLWWDGDGLCLFAKRLERGRFIWPKAESGTVRLSRAQLSMLLEGIDWRRVERTWTPEVAV